MRSTTVLSAAAALAGLTMVVNGQTFSHCNPVKGEQCKPNPGLGKTITTDWTKSSDDWKKYDGTSLDYGSKGAEFTIKKEGQAPTIGTEKYIFFGKVSVTMRASPGAGIVSSFILESDALDEIDWEWLGSDPANAQSNFFGKGNTTTYDRAAYHKLEKNPIEEFITYTIDWTKESIKWYIEDKLVRTVPFDDPLALGGANYPQTPMRVKMGSWIGCLNEAAKSDPKTKGTCDWAGGSADFSKGPFTMYVKSTTIQDYSCGGDYSYTDATGSYQSIKTDCDAKGGYAPSKPAPSANGTTHHHNIKGSGVMIKAGSGSNSKPPAPAPSVSHYPTGNATSTPTSTSYPSATPTKPSSGSTVTSNAGNALKPTHKQGILELGVAALGLGLAFLTM